MGKHCKGMCSHEPPVLKKEGVRSVYDSGYRYCTLCSRYFKGEKVICYCCNTSTRGRSPASKFRTHQAVARI